MCIRDRSRTASLHIPPAFDADLALGRTATLALAYDPDRASAQAARTDLEEAVLRLEYLFAGRRAEAATAYDGLLAETYDREQIRRLAVKRAVLDGGPAG